MARIVVIGAGSVVFSGRLTRDILCVPELADSTLVYVDIDQEALDMVGQYAAQIARQEHLSTRVETTQDRRAALDGADYVVTTFRVGGLEATAYDVNIPLKYGIDQAVGDTLGPGGIFYGQCHMPLMVDICHEMEALCPGALVINHTNPMAMLCWAMNDATRIRNVGLCHSVQGTSEMLAEFIGAPYEETAYWVAGINHMAWFLTFEWNGRDAYPLLRQRLEAWDRAGGEAQLPSAGKGQEGPTLSAWEKDTVRREIFRRFGYYVTESSPHMSEYTPYFRRTPELRNSYALRSRDPELVAQRWQGRRDERLAAIGRHAKGEETVPMERSLEYSSHIIEACETGRLKRINGNVRNTGLITNLPEGCVVEVPCMVDRLGIHPCHVGDLPPQLAALNRSNTGVQELSVKAALEGDRDALYRAVALDPLTSALLSLDEIRQMTDEMFEALLPWMPQFQ